MNWLRSMFMFHAEPAADPGAVVDNAPPATGGEPAPAEPAPADPPKPAAADPAPTDPKPPAGGDPTPAEPGKPEPMPKKPDGLLAEPEGEPGASDPPPGAPESYEDFNLPEGFVLEGERLEQTSELFKKLGLTQEHAQELIDYEVARQREEVEAHVAQLEEWHAELRKDPELGGSRFDASVATVRGFVNRTAGEDAAEVLAMLNDTGVGSYPKAFRWLHRLAVATGEDPNVGLDGGRGGEGRHPLRDLYPTMPDSAFKDK